MNDARREDLSRIREALDAASRILRDFTPGAVGHTAKSGGSPVTEADLAIDRALREALPREGEGWLSEETVDLPDRLACRRVWVVDPIDGTQEFVDGVPEWCVSVGLVEDGRPVAGGILIPPKRRTVLGAIGLGVTANGESVEVRDAAGLKGSRILASRSETARGEWERWRGSDFTPVPTGSVAHKLCLVACGEADATWTEKPKHEWDVAAGVALVLAAGGAAVLPDGTVPAFNRRVPRIQGLAAGAPAVVREAQSLLGWDAGPT